jgi:uncharacterized protein YkwD
MMNDHQKPVAKVNRGILAVVALLACLALAVPAGAARPAGGRSPAHRLQDRPLAAAEIFLPVIFQSSNCIQTFPLIPPDNLAYEGQAVALINQERASRGIAPLAIVPELTQSARLESRYLADNDYWGHTWPDGTSPWDRMHWACYDYRTAAENIAAGYPTPAAAVSGWMNSDGHRAAILNTAFTEIGLGYAYNASSTYGAYWTANFGDR